MRHYVVMISRGHETVTVLRKGEEEGIRRYAAFENTDGTWQVSALVSAQRKEYAVMEAWKAWREVGLDHLALRASKKGNQ